MARTYYFRQDLKDESLEMPVSKAARERYGFAAELFSEHGNLMLSDFAAAQRVAQQINEVRDTERYPQSAISAGELYAAGLVQELLRLLVSLYLQETDETAIERAYSHLEETLDGDLEGTLERYVQDFPAKAVYTKKRTVKEYLAGSSKSIPHRQIVFEELLLLRMANENPAMERFIELFDDEDLEQHTSYIKIITQLETFFEGEPGFGGKKLLDVLRGPLRSHPTSLEGQLSFLRTQWPALSEGRFSGLMRRLMQTLGTIQEERRERFGGGPGPAQVIDPRAEYGALSSSAGAFEQIEYERFSPDSSWMPRVVMLAKSTFVWLGQLSKQYGRDISRLDQVPDEELDELARRGFTGLWLIGLWERSAASKKIKNMRGNPDAVASAYSLYDYVIASDLGGQDAFNNLKWRAGERGVRMASDMVPNHVGVDGRWVVEHPDWFLQLEGSPYPSYTFNGPDLSNDDRVGIFLEDHYYDSSDAAVVFKRTDLHTGNERYIYHGNDGTSMPWNDTAQVNYLNAEAREAVIQTILHVARLSPIIRFDAAMTLAKRHIQRLWFPEPGSGGAIASRAQYGTLTTDDFNAAIPEEFWREVVDRVAQEVPDTLLLAEAFWMMEGYFVRTLGMHRVYNSAFMHMFKDEDNAKYRRSIKNVLEFEPEILKRYVNFMSNPDEETAIAQFGSDDKYFGVCTMLVTMPGLPMFGHGQVEGFEEKYGMEYKSAKRDETPNGWLIERHRREIFPLMYRREQFAEVENFLLYDVHTPEGGVNEDVYAYSNRVGDRASLVVFNNKFARAKGWIKEAAPHATKEGGMQPSRDLKAGLGLRAHGDDFTIFRDQISNLEFIRRSADMANGFYLELEAFKYQAFVDFREAHDYDGNYAQIHDQLGGRGVPSIEEELASLRLKPLHQSFREVLSKEVILNLRSRVESKRGQSQAQATLPGRYGAFLEKTRDFIPADGLKSDTQPLVNRFTIELGQLLPLPSLEMLAPKFKQGQEVETILSDNLTPEMSGSLYAWLSVHGLGYLTGDNSTEASLTAMRRWRLDSVIEGVFNDLGLPAERVLRLVKLAVRYSRWYELEDENRSPAEKLLELLLDDDEAQVFLGVNAHEGVRYFNRESYRELTARLACVGILNLSVLSAKEVDAGLKRIHQGLKDFAAAEKRSEYRVDKLLDVAPKSKTAKKTAKTSAKKSVTKKSATKKPTAKKSDTKASTKKSAAKKSAAKSTAKTAKPTAKKTGAKTKRVDSGGGKGSSKTKKSTEANEESATSSSD